MATFELGDEPPDNPTFREQMIWNIMDAMDDHMVFTHGNENLRVQAAKGLDRMSDIQLGLVGELVEAMQLEITFKDQEDDSTHISFEDEETIDVNLGDDVPSLPNNDEIDVKVGQEIWWELGSNEFTGTITEITENQAVVHCDQTGNRNYLDFTDFLITKDIDQETGEMIPISESEPFEGVSGDEVCWFQGTKTREGTIIWSGAVRVQIEPHDSPGMVYLEHGQYWENTDPPVKKEDSTNNTKTVQSDIQRSTCDKKFKKGDRVCWWDSGKKNYGSIIGQNGVNYSIDVDNSSITQSRQKWALIAVEWKDDPKNPKNGGTVDQDNNKTTTYTQVPSAPEGNDHLIALTDKKDVISRLVVPLPAKS